VKRIAVTGASGFIGSVTARSLRDHGHTVVPLDRSLGHDIRDADLPALIDGCDAVIHLAGVLGTSELFDQVEHAVDVNVNGTLRVLRACEKVGASYVGITMPDCWPSVYQATKLCGTRLAESFADAVKMPVTHVRAFNAYGHGQALAGPGHPQKIIPTFSHFAWRGRAIPIWGDGEQTVDLVHVDHIAQCLIVAALTQPGGTFDAGSGRELSVNTVARLVCDALGIKRRVRYFPMRAGETPGTRLCATVPGPVGFDHFDWQRFADIVRSYKS